MVIVTSLATQNVVAVAQIDLDVYFMTELTMKLGCESIAPFVCLPSTDDATVLVKQ